MSQVIDYLYDLNPMNVVPTDRIPVGGGIVTDGLMFAGGPSDAGLLLPQRNLILFAEELDNAAWAKARVSVSANAVAAPDGTTTADKLVENSETGLHRAQQTIDYPSGNFHFSLYLKAAGRTWGYLRFFTMDGNKYAWFDLTNGVVGTVESGLTTSMSDEGSGWYRCSITGTVDLGNVMVGPASADNVHTYAGDGSSGIYVWGAQLSEGSSPLAYQLTTDLQTIYDWSGQGNDAQRGSTSGADTNDPTRHGEYLTYDNTDDYVDCGSDSSVLPDAFSAFVVAKPTFGGRECLVSWRSDAARPQIILNYSSDRPMFYMGATNFRYFKATSPTNYKDGNWHSYCAQVPGTGINDIDNSVLLIDGTAQDVDSTTKSGAQTAKANLYIGDGSSTNPLSGDANIVLLYNRVITVAEALQDHAAVKAAFPNLSLP